LSGLIRTAPRKTINGNVGKLSVLFSIIVFLVVVANATFATSFDFYPLYSSFGLEKYLPIDINSRVSVLGALSIAKDDLNKVTFAAMSCLIGFALMWIFYGRRLEPYQRHNGQYMANYLVQYINIINNHFREARGIAVGVAQGARGSEDQVKADTVLWITNLQWLAFRVFFIEMYLRNILFQIHRNSSYWILFTPPGFALVLLALGFVLNEFNVFNPPSLLHEQSIFYLLFAALFVSGLLVAYWVYLRKSVSFVFESVSKVGWPKFSDVRIQPAMSHILETYVAELIMLKTMHAPQAFGSQPVAPQPPPSSQQSKDDEV
jgi:hypothetical protein